MNPNPTPTQIKKHPLPTTLSSGLPEKVFGAYLEEAATRAGWLWNHVRPLKVPGRGGKFITPASTGFPDYVLVHERWPKLLVLEIKTEVGKVSDKQKVWLNLLNRIDGVDAYMARPEDWPRILAYLNRPNRATRVETTANER